MNGVAHLSARWKRTRDLVEKAGFPADPPGRLRIREGGGGAHVPEPDLLDVDSVEERPVEEIDMTGLHFLFVNPFPASKPAAA